jgi:hypothetical protein
MPGLGFGLGIRRSHRRWRVASQGGGGGIAHDELTLHPNRIRGINFSALGSLAAARAAIVDQYPTDQAVEYAGDGLSWGEADGISGLRAEQVGNGGGAYGSVVVDPVTELWVRMVFRMNPDWAGSAPAQTSLAVMSACDDYSNFNFGFPYWHDQATSDHWQIHTATAQVAQSRASLVDGGSIGSLIFRMRVDSTSEPGTCRFWVRGVVLDNAALNAVAPVTPGLSLLIFNWGVLGGFGGLPIPANWADLLLVEHVAGDGVTIPYTGLEDP